MTNQEEIQEAINDLKVILSEITECEESICYITDIDAEPLRLAIEALEKQIPKEPESMKTKHFTFWKCPNCGAEWIIKHSYCNICGQRLYRSEENA